jgi:hypothetical protein
MNQYAPPTATEVPKRSIGKRFGLAIGVVLLLAYVGWNEYRAFTYRAVMGATVNWLMAHEKEYPTAALRRK